MLVVIPREQRPLLEVQELDYRPSETRALAHWLRGERELWWIVGEGPTICAAVRAVRRPGRFPNQLEVLVRAEHQGRVESGLVRQGIASLRGSPKKPIEVQLPMPGGQSLAALEEEGFEKLRVLIQMKRRLKYRVSVNLKA
jgi:hypothetical protein